MSYDVYLTADLGQGHLELGNLDWNYTSNIRPMLVKAGLASLTDLDGMRAGEAAARLREVVAEMESDPAGYRKLNPKNGWGDYDGFLRRLRVLIEAFDATPDASVEVSA